MSHERYDLWPEAYPELAANYEDLLRLLPTDYDEFISFYRDAFDACLLACKSLGAGAAHDLDSAILPNAHGRAFSIEVHLRMQHLISLSIDMVSLGKPRGRPFLDRCIEDMQTQLDWITSTLRIVNAVIETRGLDVPPQQAQSDSDNSHATTTYPTMRDLADTVGISPDTFGRVRKAAGIKVGLKGAAARNRRYPPSEVDKLIHAAKAGPFLERTSMAEKWAHWGSK